MSRTATTTVKYTAGRQTVCGMWRGTGCGTVWANVFTAGRDCAKQRNHGEAVT